MRSIWTCSPMLVYIKHIKYKWTGSLKLVDIKSVEYQRLKKQKYSLRYSTKT